MTKTDSVDGAPPQTFLLVSRNALFKTIVLSARSVPGTVDVLDLQIDPPSEFHSPVTGVDVSICLTAADPGDTFLVGRRVATAVKADALRQLGVHVRNISVSFGPHDAVA